MTNTTSTPVAPRVGEQGTSTPGGHYVAYRAQPLFSLEASLELISGSNPWRPGTPGSNFWSQVLSKNPATVAAAVAMGKDAGFKAREVQNHLRWLYTWGGSYVRIGGAVFVPPVQPEKPKAEKPKAKSKVRA